MAETIYATPEELRRQIEKQGTTGAAGDPALAILLGAASRLIDGYYNRPDGFVADGDSSVRMFQGSGESHLWMDESIQIDSLFVGDTPKSTALTEIDEEDYIGFRGTPKNPDFNHTPYYGILLLNSIFDSFSYYHVEGRWGYSQATPSSVKQLVIAIAARYYKQGEGAWSDTLGSSDVGRLLFRSQNADLQWLMEKTRLYRPVIA